MNHGKSCPIGPVPPLVEGRPNVLLTRAGLEALPKESRQAIIAVFGHKVLQTLSDQTGLTGLDLLWRAIAKDRAAQTRPGALVATLGASQRTVRSPILFTHAQVATWTAWRTPLESRDFMALTAGADDAAACLRLIPEGDVPAGLADVVAELLPSPGYYGVASTVSGHDLLRIYVGREDALALHVTYEPEPRGSFVIAERDADGVPVAYAPLLPLHVTQAMRELARRTGASIDAGDTPSGRAWRLAWS